MLTIAALTLREAVRRRIVAAAGLLTVVALVLVAWGEAHLAGALAARGGGVPSSLEVGTTFSALTLFLAFMFSVVLAGSSAFLGAPAIASDVDSGLFLAILPRPVRRAEVVLGKFAGLAVLLAAYAAATGIAYFAALHALTGFVPPHPVAALVYLFAQSLAVLTLALALGTRLPPIPSGLVALAAFGMAWVAGIVSVVASALDNASVVAGATVAGLVMPTDGLWRGAIWSLEPVALATAGRSGLAIAGPFSIAGPPPPAQLVWAALWLAAVLAAAVLSFRTRDL